VGVLAWDLERADGEGAEPDDDREGSELADLDADVEQDHPDQHAVLGQAELL
jgi:hypothetical protein